jgi:outer membrane protein assembly factor BamB
MYALDAEDGHTVWASQAMQDAGPYDGTVFADDGDLLVGSFEDIWRFDAADGHTVWHATRVGSVSSSCGGARFGDAFYVADAVYGGHVMVRYDVATGQRMYESPLMAGFTLQNTPMVGPDGTIYLSRTQNNPSVDYIYAFTDTGTELVEKWHIPSFANPFAEFGVGPDGSVYFAIPGPRLARIDPNDGGILNQTDVLAGFTAAHVAVDADGKVFLSNSAFATGRLYAYDADLTPRWDVAVTNINIGGPALGQNGTLVVCGIGTDMRAYRTEDPTIVPDPIAGASSDLRLACAPNPFRDATTIHFVLAQPGPVTCEVFDAAGRCVRTLLRGDGRDAGEQSVIWQGDGAGGERVAPGVYYYRVATGSGARTGRVLLAR